MMAAMGQMRGQVSRLAPQFSRSCENNAPQASKKPAKPTRKPAAKPVLPSGGNPQVPKAYGDAPMQAYIAAMPGWKRSFGRRLDALITRTVPGVRKAVMLYTISHLPAVSHHQEFIPS